MKQAIFLFATTLVLLFPACGQKKINPADLNLKGAYAVDGRIHVNTFGLPEKQPLTTGYNDFKPSWSMTGNMIVFFRGFDVRTPLPNWETAICVINTDGNGFRQLTTGEYPDFNPTWSRDGKNTVVFSRWVDKEEKSKIYFTRTNAKPGEEVFVSDPAASEYAFSCLKDGRVFIVSNRNIPHSFYYLFTAVPGGIGKYEPVRFQFDLEGLLERVSVSPSETKLTYEYKKSWKSMDYTGRTIYIADFDKDNRTVSNPEAITPLIEDSFIMTLYPRWSKDESVVIYHSDKSGYNQLYMYLLADGSTHRVSVNPTAQYQFACGEATPK